MTSVQAESGTTIDKFEPEPSTDSKNIRYSTLRRLAASACGSIVSETLTIPTDVIKVRNQLSTNRGLASGMFRTGSDIIKIEGFGGLFKGLVPALIRQVSYTGLAFMVFEPIRDTLSQFSKDPSNPGFLTRVFAGGTAGAIGISVMNPTEVLKTQIQAEKNHTLKMGQVIRTVYSHEGILGFWAGIQANIARAFLINAAEIGSYDHVKHELLRLHIVDNDGLLCRVYSSFAAGTISALVSTPVDVVKTRLMQQAGHEHLYKGMTDALIKIRREEGFIALYKGFVPIIVRKVCWCTAFFMTYEHARTLVGLPPS